MCLRVMPKGFHNKSLRTEFMEPAEGRNETEICRRSQLKTNPNKIKMANAFRLTLTLKAKMGRNCNSRRSGRAGKRGVRRGRGGEEGVYWRRTK